MDRVIAFDSDLWRESGYDCSIHKGNECFFLPAIAIRYYNKDGRDLMDVKFDHHDKITKGLFRSKEIMLFSHNLTTFEKFQITDEQMHQLTNELETALRGIAEKYMLSDWARLFAAETKLHAKLILINWDYI